MAVWLLDSVHYVLTVHHKCIGTSTVFPLLFWREVTREPLHKSQRSMKSGNLLAFLVDQGILPEPSPEDGDNTAL